MLRPIVECSEIPKNPLDVTVVKPVENNGINQEPQLVIAEFFHQPIMAGHWKVEVYFSVPPRRGMEHRRGLLACLYIIR